MSLLCPRCGKPAHKGGMQSRDKGGTGVQRYACANPPKGCGWHGTRPTGIDKREQEGVSPVISKAIAAEVKRAAGVRRYVVTAAQNATPVWAPFWTALLRYAAFNAAEILVIPIRYHNPTSVWSASAQEHDWWAEEVIPFLTQERIPLGDHMVVLGDIKTQPTARRPLEGFETISGSQSAIIGHPKLELTTIATPQQRLPKILTTTGAVTQRNYIAGKAGKMGEFHHTFGAAVVEITPTGGFHLRQINATKDGSFIDLHHEYTPAYAPKQVTAAALVMGDWHERFNDPAVRAATFNLNGIVPTLKPEILVWHDVFDGFARNPHDWRDPVRAYVKHKTRLGNVASELKQTFDAVDMLTPGTVQNVFPFSNHNDFLNRWVKNTDPRSDPENAIFWAQSYVAMLNEAGWTKNGVKEVDLFEYWARSWLKSYKRSKFLAPDDSFRVKGIELGMHGHLGANGARGELNSFAKLGVKSITGHSHSPGIRDGAYRVGTSGLLRVDYNRGPSSWLQTHAVVYANGKRSLINIIDGEWRAS